MFSSFRCEGAVYDFWELNCKIPTCRWLFSTSHLCPQCLGWKTLLHPWCPSIRQQWWQSPLCCLRDTQGQVLLLKKLLKRVLLYPPAESKQDRGKGQQFCCSSFKNKNSHSCTILQLYTLFLCHRQKFHLSFWGRGCGDSHALTAMLSQPTPHKFWDFFFPLMVARMSSAAPARLHVCPWWFWQFNGRQGWILNTITCSTQKLIPAIFHVVEAPCN